MTSKSLICTFAVFVSLMAATARGEETGANDERGLKFQLRPAKVQIFAGSGLVIAGGDSVAEVKVVGVATIHPIGKGFFVRPYLSTGIVNPEKAGVGSFQNAQLGILLGYKLSKRFTVVGGISVTALFPKYRETLNFSTATTLKKFEGGVLQLMTPFSFNRAPNGQWNTVGAVALGWTF